MKEYLISLVVYNAWASKLIEKYVIEAGESAGILPQKSSFPSVRETLIHIWNAQYIWIERLNERSVKDWPGKKFTGNTAQAAAKLVESSNEWIDFMNNVPQEKLENLIHYSNLEGTLYSNKITHIIAHVMNHSTYHRGQVITLLRGAGFTNPGSTDLIAYYRQSQL